MNKNREISRQILQYNIYLTMYSYTDRAFVCSDQEHENSIEINSLEVILIISLSYQTTRTTPWAVWKEKEFQFSRCARDVYNDGIKEETRFVLRTSSVVISMRTSVTAKSI